MTKLFSHFGNENLKKRKIGIIGYGSQGCAQAMNARDSGLDIKIGVQEGSQSQTRAIQDGFQTLKVSELASISDILVFLAPDSAHKKIFEESVAPNLEDGMSLIFAHGLSISYNLIKAPENVNILLCCPKAAGKIVREKFLKNELLACYASVYRSFDEIDARMIANEYAYSISGGMLISDTDLEEEAECDLFGEQAVICGGVIEIIKAGVEVLTENGHSPETAYFECLYELISIVNLLEKKGLRGMYSEISDAARIGGLLHGKKAIGDNTKEKMQNILDNIRSGSFAKSMDSKESQNSVSTALKENESHILEKAWQRIHSFSSNIQQDKRERGN